MSLPYIPLYIDDYEAATVHLTMTEDGAYNRLLRLIWRTPGCSIPDDDEWVFRRMRAYSDEEKNAILMVISEFCHKRNGRIFSDRLTKEFKKADETYQKRSEAGKKGGRPQGTENKRKDEKPGFDFDKAGPKQPEPEPEPYKEKDTNVSKKTQSKRAIRLDESWELPKDFYDWAIDRGIDPAKIRFEAEKMKNWSMSAKNGAKLDWMATWRNWMSDYVKNHPKPNGKSDLEDWVSKFSEHGVWKDVLGPKPNQQGCRVPEEILRRYGYAS